MSGRRAAGVAGRRRGFAALAALMIVAGIAAMVMVGLDARRDDIGREDVLLCRLQARMAAESAIAVAEGAAARGIAPPRAGEGWTLAVSGRTAVARGRCPAGGREVVLRVELDGAGRPLRWGEGE